MTRHRLPWLFCAAAALAAAAAPARAGGIAATVNDEVISSYDVDARMRLVLFSARFEDTPETRRRIRVQVLRALIDERLQLQEARRRSVSVSEPEIRRAVAALERRNDIPPGRLDDMLSRNGVPEETVLAQVRAGLAWSKLVGRRLRPLLEIGDEEIDEAIARVRSRQGQIEYRLGEIVIAAEPGREDEARAAAERFAREIRQGARFAEIARQFSRSPTAAVGGDLGWVHESDLREPLRGLLPGMAEGATTAPLETATGYRLVRLEAARRIAGDGPTDREAVRERLLLRRLSLRARRYLRDLRLSAMVDLRG